MRTSHHRATSLEEAYWTLDCRTSGLPCIPWVIELEQQMQRDQLDLVRELERALRASPRQPDFAPVIPVRLSSDGPDVVRPEAIVAIESMLDERLSLPAVFDDPRACVHALGRWSGGHVGHILYIARRAVAEVESERVTVADIEKAGLGLGRRLITRLRPNDLPRTMELHRTHRILHTEQDLRMLGVACVLTQIGEAVVWWNVHPAIWADELFQSAPLASMATTSADGGRMG